MINYIFKYKYTIITLLVISIVAIVILYNNDILDKLFKNNVNNEVQQQLLNRISALEQERAQREINDIEEDSLITSNPANNPLPEEPTNSGSGSGSGSGLFDRMNLFKRPNLIEQSGPSIPKIDNNIKIEKELISPDLLKEIEPFMNSMRYELNFYYRTNCVYSKKFLPLWLEVMSSLPNNCIPREINCTGRDESSVCRLNDIRSVPTLVLLGYEVGDNDNQIKLKETFTSARTYKNIKDWLRMNGVNLKYNPNAEHFSSNNLNGNGDVNNKLSKYILATGIKSGSDKLMEDFDALEEYLKAVGGDKFSNLKKYLEATGTKEGFVGFDLSQQPILDIEDLRAHHDREYEKLSAYNKHGEYKGYDEDSHAKAVFSICEPGSKNPGYSVNAPHVQHGCVYPEPGTGINNKFDAAFIPVANYLNSQLKKPYFTPNGELAYKTMTNDEKLQSMKENAVKYKNKIQEFGLCQPNKLNAKYQIPEKIRRGILKAPQGMTAEDYEETSMAAEAIATACLA